MAFASVIIATENSGSMRHTYGTFASTGGDEGGNIDTGLTRCDGILLQHGAAAVVASAPVVNETLPVAGGAVTIVTVANTSGYWHAWGY